MRITRAHGSGGRSTHELIESVFMPAFGDQRPTRDDAVSVLLEGRELLVTTDAHVVEPFIFSGGDIGKLAVTGVINDLLTRGGRPRFFSATFVLEEGLRIDQLKTVVKSFAQTMRDASIRLICADTKVVPARGEPGLMISSTLFGEPLNAAFAAPGPKSGDVLILSAAIGAHGLALLRVREKIPFQSSIESDCASLFPLLEPLIQNSVGLHGLRDVTRGGLAAVLHEWSDQHRLSFEIDERRIPIAPEVKAGLALLGIDSLEVANEGVMLLSVAPSQAERILAVLKSHSLGHQAAVIGQAKALGDVGVVLITEMGGRRFVPWPEALNLPRIC